MLLQEHKGSATNAICRQKITAVWVDDDDTFFLRTAPIFNEMFKLSGQFFEIRTFHSPISAITRIKSSPPDIVLTNLYSPDPGGIKLIYGIRKFNETVPIIAVSSRNHPMIIETITAVGANAYHFKGDLNEREGVLLLQHDIDTLLSQNTTHAIK